MLFRKKRIKPSDFHVSVDITSDSNELGGMNIDVQYKTVSKTTLRRLQAEDAKKPKFRAPIAPVSTSQLRHDIALTSSSPFFPDFDKTTSQRIRNELTASFDSGESVDKLKKRLEVIIDNRQMIEHIATTESVYCYQAAVVRYGELSGAVGKEWQAGYKCCEDCKALDNKKALTGSKFASKDKLGHPPLHAGCTCGIRIMYPNE